MVIMNCYYELCIYMILNKNRFDINIYKKNTLFIEYWKISYSLRNLLQFLKEKLFITYKLTNKK